MSKILKKATELKERRDRVKRQQQMIERLKDLSNNEGPDIWIDDTVLTH